MSVPRLLELKGLRVGYIGSEVEENGRGSKSDRALTKLLLVDCDGTSAKTFFSLVIGVKPFA
jgi:hypothetical protein